MFSENDSTTACENMLLQLTLQLMLELQVRLLPPVRMHFIFEI